MAKTKADKEAQILIEESLHVAEKLKIKKILVVCEKIDLWNSILPHYAKNQFIIAVSGKKLAESIKVETFLCDYSFVARTDRLAYILRAAVESGRLVKGERVVCLYSLGGYKLLDSMLILKVEEQLSPISPRDLKRIGKNIPVDVLFSMVNLAIELGQEGREGVPVGTILVVGDTEKVLELSKPMIFNPFLGYKKEERNIFDQKVQESIKELALIDGAFVVNSEGIVEAAGMFLHAGSGKTKAMRGLGARHAAAAAISLHTNSVAVAISESTGAVRIFSGGKAVRTFKSYRPQGRAHKK